MDIPDQDFEKIVSQALDELPDKYISNLNNVVIVYADEPTPEQRIELKLHCNETLYGLYQGIPLTKRGMGYNLVLPDKITIFKKPLIGGSRDLNELRANTKHTLWHEIAHHFGLDHKRIHSLEDKANLQKG